jgi:hypothetical protein
MVEVSMSLLADVAGWLMGGFFRFSCRLLVADDA